MRSTLFSLSLIFALNIFNKLQVFGIFLLTSSIFFARFCLSVSYCDLSVSPLMLRILVSITSTFDTKVLQNVFMKKLISIPSLGFLCSIGTVSSLSTSN